MKKLGELIGRLARARGWVVGQFGGTLLLILLGLGWTRLPDKHIWQVALTLLIPVLLGISALELQAGTVRALADDDGKRVKLVWGAMTLLVWVAVGAAFWAVLDWCDDQFPLWAGYLNSQAPAHWRAKVLTYQHISDWLAAAEWVLRWVVLPAKVIPYAMATALWGWRLPLRRVLRLIWNWRWWLGVVLAALVGVLLPGRWFDKAPGGTVTAQVWAVGLKLAGAYLLGVGAWVFLLAWAATLFPEARKPPTEEVLVPAFLPVRPTGGSRAAVVEIPPEDSGAE